MFIILETGRKRVKIRLSIWFSSKILPCSHNIVSTDFDSFLYSSSKKDSGRINLVSRIIVVCIFSSAILVKRCLLFVLWN